MRKIPLLACVAVSACAPTAQLQLSAGRIGCATQDIVVGNTSSTRHTQTWSADCRGQTYFCSSTDDFREVVCRLSKPSALPAVAQTAEPALRVPVATSSSETAAPPENSAPTPALP